MLVIGVKEENGGNGIGAVDQRGGAGDMGIAGGAVDLVFHAEGPAGGVGGTGNFRRRFEHDGADKIFLREEQFGFAIAIHIGRGEPGLVHGTPGGIDIGFIKGAVFLLEEDFDFLVGNERDEIGEAVLVDIMDGEGDRVALEAVAEFLGFIGAIGLTGDQGAGTILINDDGEGGFAAGLQDAGGHDERFAIEREERGEGKPAGAVEAGGADGVFILAQYENDRMAIFIPIGDGDLGNAGEAGEFFRRGEGAIRLLEIDGELAGFRFGYEEIGAAIAIDIRPEDAALGGFGLVERQHLELALVEGAGDEVAGFAREFGNKRAAGGLDDGNEIIRRVAGQGIERKGAYGISGEIEFGTQLAAGALETDAVGSGAVEIDQEQVVFAVAVNVDDLDGFGSAGVIDFDGFGEGVVRILRPEIDFAVVAKKGDVGETVAVEIADGEGVGVHAAVVDMPAFGFAPAVGAEVVADDEVFGITEIDEIGAAIAVEVGDGEGGEAFLGGDGIDAEAGVGREFVDLGFALDGGVGGGVGFAGEVVKDVDFGPEIVRDDDVVEAVAIDIGDVEEGDILVDGVDFFAAEAEEVVGIVGGGGKGEQGGKRQGREDQFLKLLHPRNVPLAGRIGEIIRGGWRHPMFAEVRRCQPVFADGRLQVAG